MLSLLLLPLSLSLSQINSQPETELWKKSNSILWRALAVLAACVGRLAAWLLRGGGCNNPFHRKKKHTTSRPAPWDTHACCGHRGVSCACVEELSSFRYGNRVYNTPCTILIEKARNENLSLDRGLTPPTEEGTKNKHFFISLNFHLPFVCGVMF